MTNLPIEDLLPQLGSALASHPVVVLEAPPGAGKTTAVPTSLLDAPWLEGRSIIMLEPRRLAARGAAEYMARQMGESVGQTVGYRIRFDNRVGRQTRIEVVTEGILTRRLQDDPLLEGVGLVIFDEFHERHLHSDLALALCRDVQQGLREDLRLLLMSATLDPRLPERFSAPLVKSEGRSYPVELHYLPREPDGPIAQTAASAVVRVLDEETEGDILVFLPGAGEIRRCAGLLLDSGRLEPEQVHQLFGELPFERQRAALEPDGSGRRKVVLATPIAETSLTIEGVRIVIDSGWMRRPRFHPASGLSQLDTVRVTRANADQRAGRAGRLGPGVCYRLWSESVQQGLVPNLQPEIAQTDLSSLVLELAAWGIDDPQRLTWLDPPPTGAVAQARAMLQQLGAVGERGNITEYGKAMAQLPLHPRLSAMVAGAQTDAERSVACDLAALLSERDILRSHQEVQNADLALRLEALHGFRSQGTEGARRFGADRHACSAAERVARRLRRSVGVDAPKSTLSDEAIFRLLLQAYPDRLARHISGTEQYQLVSGGRCTLMKGSGMGAAQWIIAANMGGKGRPPSVRLALAGQEEWVRRELATGIERSDETVWDPERRAVVSMRTERLGEVVLDSQPIQASDAQSVTGALMEGIRQHGIEQLPWSSAANQLRRRVELLRRCDPQGDWPAFDAQTLTDELEQWLAPFINGQRNLDELKRIDLEAALLARLDWPQQQRLEEGAPSRIAVPSGHRREIDYSGDEPVLAVKLQELFGLAETPAVCWGRVPLTLHLLSPARRPIQVTRDLRGFWDNTYQEVKKELKGRYPKHPWPDDPWQATATAGTKRRR